jgi:hypothetical protein
MERSSKLLLVATTALFAACETPTAPDAARHAAHDIGVTTSSTSATTFSGEATVVQTSVTPPTLLSPITINLVETGKLPESGGALHETLLDLDISKDQTAGLVELGARVGHASTVGQGKASRAQATVADLNLNVNGTPIQATFLQALASAVCDAARGAIATGSSTLADLVVNGTPISVGTAPNQTIVDLPALVIIANEQRTKPGGANDADLTVNALHVTAYAVNLDGSRGAQLADVVVASAHADIHCGLCADQGDNFTTGGGWINAGDPPQLRRHFAVAGGYKNGDPWGHLTYMDKAASIRVKGDAVFTYKAVSVEEGGLTYSRSTITGIGHLDNGTTVHYTVIVEDKGEPGDADTFEIHLDEIAYNAVGVLGGGNIQFHAKPSPCGQ